MSRIKNKLIIKSLNKGISSPVGILIILICSVLIGGVLVWQLKQASEKEIKEPEVKAPEEVEVKEEITPQPTPPESEPEKEDKVFPQPRPALPTGYVWYYNKEWGFKIAYPETWKKMIVIEEIETGEQMFSATFGEKPYDVYAPAIVIRVNWVIFENCEAERVKELFPKTTEVIINGKKALETSIENMAGQKLRIIILSAGDKCYTIVCSVEAVVFDKYIEIFNDSINSFTLE